jgi:hypothetical protein
MSSASSVQFMENAMREVLRFRYGNLLIRSTPAISLAFIAYVTFRGVLW